jgi:Na+/proline symporter
MVGVGMGALKSMPFTVALSEPDPVDGSGSDWLQVKLTIDAALLLELISAAIAAAVVATSSSAGAVKLIVSSTVPRRSVVAKFLTPFHSGSLPILTRLAGSLSVLNHNSA